MKLRFISVLLFIFLLLGCSNDNSSQGVNSRGDISSIDVQSGIESKNFWAGFVVSGESVEEVPPRETLIFLEEEHWYTFTEKNSTAFAARSDSTMYETVDFSEYALVYTICHDAKPLRAQSNSIIGFDIEENQLVPIYDEEAKKIPAVTSKEFTEVWFLSFDLVKKQNIPADLENIYQEE